MKKYLFYSVLILLCQCKTQKSAEKAPKPSADKMVTGQRDSTEQGIFIRNHVDSLFDVSTLKIVGNGDIQKASNAGEQIPANTGMGAVFQRRYTGKTWEDVEVKLIINIASTVDTVKAEWNSNNGLVNRRAFGSSLLLLDVSSQSATVNFKGYFRHERSQDRMLFQGLQINFVGSNKIWSVGDSANTAANVSIIGLSAGVFHEFIPDRVRIENDVSITGAFAYQHLWISGDAGVPARAYTFRKLLLGTDMTSYPALSSTISLRFQNIEASAGFIGYFSESSIEGFSHGQFVTTVRFVGGFPMELKKIAYK